jgi:hypothetical protein
MGRAGTLYKATTPLSLRDRTSFSSRLAHQEAESTVVNLFCLEMERLGKAKAYPTSGDRQKYRAPCHFGQGSGKFGRSHHDPWS